MGNRLYKIVDFEDLKGTPLIKGCDLASLDGDLNAKGAPFGLRLRCADGAKSPAHWHPTGPNITVLNGTWLVGTRETFDGAKLQAEACARGGGGGGNWERGGIREASELSSRPKGEMG